MQQRKGQSCRFRGKRRNPHLEPIFIMAAAATADTASTSYTHNEQKGWKNPWRSWQEWWDLRSKVSGQVFRSPSVVLESPAKIYGRKELSYMHEHLICCQNVGGLFTDAA